MITNKIMINSLHNISVSELPLFKNKILTTKPISLALVEISKLLNTGLDPESLAICVKLCEAGVNPEALASVVQELRREAAALQVSLLTWICTFGFLRGSLMNFV